MTYKLYIGNKRYSSWSLRPWAVFKALDIPFEEKLQLFKPSAQQVGFLEFSPTGKVPCLVASTHGPSITVWDSLAIIDYVAESHPGVWPSDAAARAWARSATSEMHSGFSTIKDECGFNVGLRIELNAPSDALQRDLARLSALFKEGLDKFGGPWLAGSKFTAVDAFYAPIASRYKTYGLQLEEPAKAYLDRLFEHPAVQLWVEAGIKETQREPHHEDDCVRDRTVLKDLSI
jgi:glutathione S-transferase